jgi:hypothetical protein
MKGNKLFDLSNNTLLVSRDVVFHEDMFPYHAHFQSSHPQYHNLVLPHSISDYDDINLIHPRSSSFDHVPHDSAFPSLSPPIVQPVPVSISHDVHPIRKSSRVKCKPSYLQNFHYQMATSSLSSSSPYSTVSSIRYDLSTVLSYDKLSPSYKYFFFFFLFFVFFFYFYFN